MCDHLDLGPLFFAVPHNAARIQKTSFKMPVDQCKVRLSSYNISANVPPNPLKFAYRILYNTRNKISKSKFRKIIPNGSFLTAKLLTSPKLPSPHFEFCGSGGLALAGKYGFSLVSSN